MACAAAKYGVRAEDIVLVHDELDKPLGKTVFKNGGSARLVGFAQLILTFIRSYQVGSSNSGGESGGLTTGRRPVRYPDKA